MVAALVSNATSGLALFLGLGLFLFFSTPAPALAQEAGPRDGGSAQEAIAQARECGIPETTLERLLASGLDGGLAREDSLAILDLYLAACDQGLPLEPLADKTSEGLAKHVSGPRIMAALQSLRGDLALAQSHLSEAAKSADVPQASRIEPDMVVATATALAAGLTDSDLDELLVRSSPADLAMRVTAVEMAGLFLEAGFPKDQALELARQGLDAAGLTPDWKRASMVAARARQRGVTDDEFFQTAQAVLAKGGPLKDLMEELGFTARDLQHGATNR